MLCFHGTVTALEAQPKGAVGILLGMLQTARPKQWLKNVLVFAAVGAAGQLGSAHLLIQSLIAFAAFCLVSSGTYFLNDAADVESDRRHPKKRYRPMAAGVFSARAGRIAGAIILAAGIGLAFVPAWQFGVVAILYVVNTTVYSTWLKHVAVFDILSVAVGFLLRAVGGGAATRIPLSNWFLIVASFGSLFIVAGKRYAEHRALESAPDGHVRPVMEFYSASFLNYVRAVSSSAVLVAYCLFAFERAQVLHGHVPFFQISILPFAAGILQYGLLLEHGHGESPEDMVIRSKVLLACGACWAILFLCGTRWGS
jgi:decaprenyl-phosphate phosphoribosyltransferase